MVLEDGQRGSAIELPFDRFQAVDLPFDDALAPRMLQRPGHGGIIASECLGQSQADPASRSVRLPSNQAV